jgi:hypothetical protein
MGDRWHGLRYPFKRTAQGQFNEPEEDQELIDSSIRFILSTAPGEYITLPEFGCKLIEDLFEPNDSVLVARVKSHVNESLFRWESRIDVTEINVIISEDELRLFIGYFIKSNPAQLRFFEDTFERRPA